MDFFVRRRKEFIFWILIGIVGISSLFFFKNMFLRRNPEIVFLNVGQGDAILIRTPHGRNFLIDAGPDESIRAHLDAVLPLSERSLDGVIATHPDLDHVGGFLSLLHTTSIAHFFHSGLAVAEPEYREIIRELKRQSIPTTALSTGDILSLGDGMYLYILSPYAVEKVKDANEASVVVLLSYRGTHILLTGDAPQHIEQQLVSSYGDELQSQILKLGHHGSKTSSSALFLHTVHPAYAIVSAGCRNRFGHPHFSVLQTAEKEGAEILQTCFDGDIHFLFENGKWVYQPKE